jgi:hypothetical protein
MFIIGIDPGLSGGIAIIPLYSFKETIVYSLADYSLAQLAVIFQEYRAGGGPQYTNSTHNSAPNPTTYIDSEIPPDTHCEIFLEEPQLPMLNTHNSNNFSVQAHKKLARSLGQLEGICIAAGYPPNLVSPRKWQGFLACLSKGDKNITKNLAIKCFPFLNRECKSGPNKGLPVSTITHATADALLIALYGYLQYQNPERIPLTVRNNVPSIPLGRKIPTDHTPPPIPTPSKLSSILPHTKELNHGPKRSPLSARYGPHRPRTDR